jgi:hypothetical protein
MVHIDNCGIFVTVSEALVNTSAVLFVTGKVGVNDTGIKGVFVPCGGKKGSSIKGRKGISQPTAITSQIM